MKFVDFCKYKYLKISAMFFTLDTMANVERHDILCQQAEKSLSQHLLNSVAKEAFTGPH